MELAEAAERPEAWVRYVLDAVVWVRYVYARDYSGMTAFKATISLKVEQA